MTDSIDLTHHLLLAMPLLDDPFFKQSVCYICEHTDEGAMGFIINKPMGIQLNDILDELEIDPSKAQNPNIMQGGPVSPEQGFVLYQSTDNNADSSLVGGSVHLTTSKEILSAIAKGEGPNDSIICLGYAGWHTGQLEAEIANNSWLTIPADETLLFHTDSEKLATTAANTLGINLSLLSGQSGHA